MASGRKDEESRKPLLSDELEFHDDGLMADLDTTLGNFQGKTVAVDVDNMGDSSNQTDSTAERRGAAQSLHWLNLQQYFDVTTAVIGGRLLGALVPQLRRSFLQVRHSFCRPPQMRRTQKQQPSLLSLRTELIVSLHVLGYLGTGVWVDFCASWFLILLTAEVAVMSNFTSYIEVATTESKPIWDYDFSKVSAAALSVFSYWLLVPGFIYSALWWKGALQYTFVEIIAVYGYSLTVFVPMSILAAFPFDWLRYSLISVTTVLSLWFILRSIWVILSYQTSPMRLFLLVLIVVCHLALGAGFMFYFFKPSLDMVHSLTTVTTHAPTGVTVTQLHNITKRAAVATASTFISTSF